LKRAGSLEEDYIYEEGVKPVKEELSEKQQHQLKHRELFLSRQVETLPATHIRGKCSVTLLNETESLLSYLNRDVSMNQCAGHASVCNPVLAYFLFYFSNAVLSVFYWCLFRSANGSCYQIFFLAKKMQQ